MLYSQCDRSWKKANEINVVGFNVVFDNMERDTVEGSTRPMHLNKLSHVYTCQICCLNVHRRHLHYSPGCIDLTPNCVTIFTYKCFHIFTQVVAILN